MQTVGSISKTVPGVTKEEVFRIWSDVDNWHRFNHGIEYAKLEGAFEAGERFVMGLKGGGTVKLTIHEVTPGKSFTDVTNFPFAKMYGIHGIIEQEGGVELNASIRIEGALAFLWKKLVAQKVADKLEEDMESLIALVKHEKNRQL